MGLRSFFLRKLAGADEAAASSPRLTAPAATEPLTPAQLAELRDAWGELSEAAKSSGVTGLHACSRSGKPWQEDVASVRALTSILRDLPTEDTAAGPIGR